MALTQELKLTTLEEFWISFFVSSALLISCLTKGPESRAFLYAVVQRRPGYLDNATVVG